MSKNKYIDEKKAEAQQDRARQDAADKARPRCSTCGKYTDKKEGAQCFGHSGGGSGSEKTESKESSAAPASASGTSEGKKTQATPVITESGAVANTSSHPKSRDKAFDSEIISDLLTDRLLLIDNDSDTTCTLTIKLLCQHKHLTPEQKNAFKIFVNTILKELEEFKREKGISESCKFPEHDKEGNILSLRIALPLEFYDAFIQRLASKQLVPRQNIEQKPKERVKYQKGMNHFDPTPFSTKPIPYANRYADDEDVHNADKHKAHKDKSSIRVKSILDGLKPKGWK